jgi:PIN domain-containing protein
MEDVDWLPFVGQRAWVVVTKDKRIRTRPLERQALINAGVRAFILVSGNLKGTEMAAIFAAAGHAEADRGATAAVYRKNRSERKGHFDASAPAGTTLKASEQRTLPKMNRNGYRTSHFNHGGSKNSAYAEWGRDGCDLAASIESANRTYAKSTTQGRAAWPPSGRHCEMLALSFRV